MNTSKCACLLLFAAAAGAQEASTTATQTAVQKNFWQTLKYTGLVDVNYSKNWNEPASNINTYRYFDQRANHVDLNYIEGSLEYSPAPIGFRIDVGAGKTAKLFHGAETAGKAFQYIQQVYVSLKPEFLKGIQIDAGKFNTSAGAEVTETHLNWNYSRSYLFSYGPFYHLGIRTTIPVHKNYSAGFQVFNGWNYIKDNNSGKSVGLTGALTTSKVSWFHSYIVGPERNETTDSMRNYFDTTLLLTPNEKANVSMNFAIAKDSRPGEPGSDKFYGLSTMARFNMGKWFAFAPRYEVFRDKGSFFTGTDQTINAFTMTGDFKARPNMIARFEYRADHSNRPVFERSAGLDPIKHQNTFLVGLLYFFESKK